MDFALEGNPDDDQKNRLEDFLTELMLLTRRYNVLLLDQEETVQILDLRRQCNLVGVGIVAFTEPGDDSKVVSYMAADSILDGAWLVDTDGGPVEQRQVSNVFPMGSSS